MIVIKFEPEHLKFLDLQEKQSAFKELIVIPEYGIGLKESGTAWSLFEENSMTCIMCGGIMDAGYGRGIMWALLSKHANRHMIRCTKETLKRIKGFNRLEFTATFDDARRWAEILGFFCETPDGMKKYFNEETHYLYSRIL